MLFLNFNCSPKIINLGSEFQIDYSIAFGMTINGSIDFYCTGDKIVI
jgi:hypothetical protein